MTQFPTTDRCPRGVRTESQLAAAQLTQRRQRACARSGVTVDVASTPASRIEAER